MSAGIIAQAGSGLFQFLQGLSSASPSAASASAATGASSNASAGATTAAGGHHHKHGGGAFEKLANAVTSALQSVTTNGSTDINKTITDALTKIFKNGSLSPTGETDPTADTTQQIAGADSAAVTDSTAKTGGLPDAFVQTLKSFGITPQQFQADLASAVKAAQGTGTFDPSALFKNFPTGSAVDTVG